MPTTHAPRTGAALLPAALVHPSKGRNGTINNQDASCQGPLTDVESLLSVQPSIDGNLHLPSTGGKMRQKALQNNCIAREGTAVTAILLKRGHVLRSWQRIRPWALMMTLPVISKKASFTLSSRRATAMADPKSSWPARNTSGNRPHGFHDAMDVHDAFH